MSLLDSLKSFVRDLNSKGIPIPLVRLKGQATLTGTMAIMSFTTALLGQLGKITQLLGEVDLTQANYLFLICLGAYLGNKKLSSDGKSVVLEEAKKENEQ